MVRDPKTKRVGVRACFFAGHGLGFRSSRVALSLVRTHIHPHVDLRRRVRGNENFCTGPNP